MQKTTKVIIAFLWLIAIGYFYFFKNHPYYLESFTFLGRVITTLIFFTISIGIVAGVQVLWNHFKKKLLNEFKLSVWKCIVILLILTSGLMMSAQLNANLALYEGGTIFQDEQGWGVLPEGMEAEEGMSVIITNNTLVSDADEFLKILPEEVSQSFTKANTLKSAWLTTVKIATGLGVLALFLLVSFAIGHRILRLTKIGKEWIASPQTQDEFLLSTGSGLGVYMAMMFLFAIFSVAYFGAVVTTAIVLTVISWRDAWGLIKTATIRSLSLEINYKSFASWAVLGAILVFCYNLMGILRPMPIGWDDSGHYLFLPEKIAQTKSLLDGAGGMYNWELINTIGAYTSDAMIPMFVNFGGGLLALSALYLVLKLFMRKETALIMTSLFYIMPTVIFQSSTDLKNDIPLLFFILLAMYAFARWFKDEKNANSWLYLAGAMIGIGIGIKMTAMMVLIVMLAMVAGKLGKWKSGVGTGMLLAGTLLLLIWVGEQNQYQIPITAVWIAGIGLILSGVILIAIGFKKLEIKILEPIGIFLAIIFLTLTPWIIKNTVVDGMSASIGTYYATNSNNTDIEMAFLDECENKEFEDEFAGYVTGRGEDKASVNFLSLFKMPWQMTMNSGFTSLYVDITMVFLGLLPLLIWYFIEKKDKTYKLIAGSSALYFTIFILFFVGVPWYGYMGFCMLLILIGRLTEAYEGTNWNEEKLLSLIPKIAIGITMTAIVFVKIAIFGGMDQLAYAAGLIDKEKYISTVNPGVLATVEIMDDDNDINGTYIYRIGGATAYFLAGIDAGFLHDEALDIFACMKQQYSDEEIVELMKDLNISYISLDYTYAVDQESEAYIRDRYAELYDFGKDNLEVEIEDGDYVLFKVL